MIIEEEFNTNLRSFRLRLLKYTNGCILSVSEGSEDRIGGIYLILKQEKNISSTTIIPERYGGVLLEVLAQSTARYTKGIILTTLYLKNTLTSEEASTVLNKLENILSKLTP
ncbi:MAG: hypothetical protein QXW32_07285 [Nitrososphaerales archaeon]